MRKNRHRAGKRKKEKIERARAAEAALEIAHAQFETLIGRPIARVNPQPAREPPALPGPSIPFVDLSDEDTVPYDQHLHFINLANAALAQQDIPVVTLNDTDDEEPVVINRDPLALERVLEPLDPDAPYNPSELTYLFVTLDRYAQSVYNNSENP